MEALAAVGLASNIVQFVQFGISLVSKTSEVQRSGSGQLQANEELDLIAKDLSLQCAKIQQGCEGQGRSSLLKLSLACKQVSDDLVTVIAKMKRKAGSIGKWSSFQHALRSVLNSQEIEALTDRIEALRSQMTMQLLISLKDDQRELSTMMYQLTYEMQLHASKRNKRHLRTSGGDRSFQSLENARSQNSLISDGLVTINCMGVGPNFTLDSRRADIDREKMIEQVLQAISQIRPPLELEQGNDQKEAIDEMHLEKVRQCATSALDLVHERKILQSLTFDMMQFREAIITNAHSGTFDWLLQSEEQGFNLERAPEHVRLPFTKWLEHSNGVFWVAGKPGSGKSTLMKHILNDPKTRQYLETWARDCPLIIAGYFFWHRGNELQRSQQGLLRSLLYTIFQATPGLANQLCSARIIRAHPPWTLSELQSIFKQLGHGELVKHKFCFFIDGLDEYSGDHFELVENLQSLANSTSIKLCLASRPWPCFEDAFGKLVERRLYLQDLTKPDIERYVREKLEMAKAQTVCEGNTEEAEEINEIVNEVVEKSQGVFLWVTLVVRSLREGLANGDSITTLGQRVQDFPADLEPFFETLLQAVEPKYQRIMAITFLVALETTALPLVTYSFLEEEDEFATSLPIQVFGADKVLSIQKKMRRRINGRYKGLLECWDKTQPMGDYRLAVEFLHRTVRDFLQTAPIQSLLYTYVDKAFDVYTPLCRIRLAQLKSMPRYQIGSLNDVVIEILHSARMQQAQTEFYDYSLLYQLGEIVMSRPDIAIDSVAEYLGIVSRKGLYVYLQDYLTRNPNCLAEDVQFSSIAYLVARYTRTSDPDWGREFDVQEPEETLFMAKMLLAAGSRPTVRNNGTSGWVYLVSFVSNPSREVAEHLTGVIEPLLREFVRHGARFTNLLENVGEADMALLLIRTAVWHAPALDLLEDLFKHGCDPETKYSEIHDASIWSTILAEVAGSLTYVRSGKLKYAVDAIVSCLNHGASRSSTLLSQILERPGLAPNEKAHIRTAMKQTSESKDRETKDKKNKTRGFMRLFGSGNEGFV